MNVAEKDWPANKVAMWPLDKIIPYETNPRKHPEAQIDLIAASMLTDGVIAPILVDEEGGVIIYGHGRRLAALKNSFKRYPVIVAVGWSEEQKKKVRISDNSLGALSTWDDALLSGELDVLSSAGVELPLLGFTNEQLAGWGFNVADGAFPELTDADRSPFQQLTFTLHDTQVETVKAAMEIAKAAGAFHGPNENSNGNALARICEAYRRQVDQDRPDPKTGGKRAGKKVALQRKGRRK